MSITIEVKTNINFKFDYEKLANKVILYTMEQEAFLYEAEINLSLVDNDEIQAINREYRKIDAPTDVLSFPLLAYTTAGDFSELEDDMEDNFNPDTGEVMLGDIIISVPKVYAQAEDYGHSVEREFAFLIVHSMLHLFGYDHMTPEEANFMETKQNEILNKLNIIR